MPPFSALYALKLALTSWESICLHADLQNWMEPAGLGDFSVEMLAPPAPQWLRARKPR
jgi:hypothetical protein